VRWIISEDGSGFGVDKDLEYCGGDIFPHIFPPFVSRRQPKRYVKTASNPTKIRTRDPRCQQVLTAFSQRTRGWGTPTYVAFKTTLSPRSAVVSEGPRINMAGTTSSACGDHDPTSSSYLQSSSLTVSSVLTTHSSSPDIPLRAAHDTCPLSHSSTGEIWSIWTSPCDSTWKHNTVQWVLSFFDASHAKEEIFAHKRL
jgi:hypothetical protein